MKNESHTNSDWQQYVEGLPADIVAAVDLLRTKLVQTGHLVTQIAMMQAEGDVSEENGIAQGEEKPRDNAEKPDTGPWLDAPNYKAKIRSIRTDANGNYRGTTLEALVDIPNVAQAGGIFILHNPNWESEFKRAQSAGLEICLRVSGGKVSSIEVLS